MTHEGQMQFWPDAVLPPAPPKQKRRNPRGNGGKRRDDGCARALANEPDETFKDQGLRVANELLNTFQPWAMEDLRDRMTIRPHHPNCYGALMRLVRRLPNLRVIGSKEHEFDSANGRRIPVYIGVRIEGPNVWQN